MSSTKNPPIDVPGIDLKTGQFIPDWYDRFKYLDGLQPLSEIVFPAAGVTSIGGATGAIALDANFTIPGNVFTLVSAIVAGAVTSSSPSAGVGYATGAGGTVTQATNKSTAVTLNKTAGQITTNNASLGGATAIAFTLNNSAIGATDVIVHSISGGIATAATYTLIVDAIGAGTCRFVLRNQTGGALSEAVVINFAVIKAVTS